MESPEPVVYPAEVAGDEDALITQLAELLLELAEQDAAVLESPQQVNLKAA